MEELKVIIRREYDPYMKMWKYLAAFPEDRDRLGNIMCLPFYFSRDGKNTIFECHDYVCMGYYYKTKIVHAKTDEAEKCRAAIEHYYNHDPYDDPVHLRLVEKIMR